MAIEEDYRNRGLKIVAVSYDEDLDEVEKFLDEKGYTFEVLMDDRDEGPTGPLYQVGGIPTLFLIDAGGVVRWRKVGFSPGDETEIRERVEAMVSAT